MGFRKAYNARKFLLPLIGGRPGGGLWMAWIAGMAWMAGIAFPSPVGEGSGVGSVVGIAMAQGIEQKVVYSSEAGMISFTSDAPLELISAASKEMKGAIDPADGSFVFLVSSRSFKGFNSELQQEHFYENYIEADKFPNSTFKGKIIEKIDFTQEGTYEVRAKGIFEVHGVPQERIIRGTLTVGKDAATVISSFTVLLEDHKITVPKVVNQKIAETIKVTLDITMSKTIKP